MKSMRRLFFSCALFLSATATYSNTTFRQFIVEEDSIGFSPISSPTIERPEEHGHVLFFLRPLSMGNMARWADKSSEIISDILGETPQVDGIFEIYYPQDSDSNLKEVRTSVITAFKKNGLLEQLKNKKVILLGHSLGANIAIATGKEIAPLFPTWVVSIGGAPLGYPSTYSNAALFASMVSGAIPDMMPQGVWHNDVLSNQVPTHMGFNITFISSTEGTGKTKPEDFSQRVTLEALNRAVKAGSIENHDRINPSPSFEKIISTYSTLGPDWIFFSQNSILSHMAMLNAQKVLDTLKDPETQKNVWSHSKIKTNGHSSTEL